VSNMRFNKKREHPANTLYIGIDIAKNKHCARCVNNINEFQGKAFFFTNRSKGFEQLVAQIGRWLGQFNYTKVLIGMEPTAGYWEPLYYYLEQSGYEVKLVPSLKVKRSKDLRDNSPLKSDEKDALLIADLLKNGNFIEFKCADTQKEVKTLLKHAEDLDKTIGVYRNHIENFLSVHFPEFGEVFNDLTSPTVRNLLGKYPFPADIVDAGFKNIEELLMTASCGRINPDKARRLIHFASESIGVKQRNHCERLKIENVLKILETVYSQLKEVERLLKEKVKFHPMYEILKSVKGIGTMTIAAIISSLGDLKRYRNSRQVLKMVGLNLYRFSSGRYRSSDRISRRGLSLLRRYLFMAALGNCREGSIFYEKYICLVSRGVPKKKAIVAIMRKMLKLLYALVRDNRKYEIDYMPSRAKSDVIVIKRAAA
jgi:transposase